MKQAQQQPRALSPVRLAKPSVAIECRLNGEVILRSGIAPCSTPRQLGDYLRDWARQAPDRCFLAERDQQGEWRKLNFGDAAAQVDRISQALLQRGHGPGNPVAALCDNCINMALLKLGAMQVGIPFLPISPAYSLMSEDHAKLKYVVEAFTPSLIYVPQIRPFARALNALALAGVDLIADDVDPAFPSIAPFIELLAAEPGQLVKDSYAAVGPDTVAKILLTSGSTGMPKGVINTHGMMCANGVAVDQVWPFLPEKPPILVDWLPWNHTFGTNFNFNQILRHGGTMYIDSGKPVPGKIDLTVRNLREIQPTLLYNVPRGFDMLLPALEQDEGFARRLFERIDIIFYAGAALPPHLRERLDALSLATRGELIPILSSLGSTETAPVATLVHWHASVSAGVGLPVPGVEIKLVPDGEKLEFRVRGRNITPGYYRQPEQTQQAFDSEGFFKLGDAVTFVDPARPEAGLAFDGRVSENFKLSSGTWVHVGELRVASISAAAPIIQDAVLTGHDRDDVGLLAFLNLEGCRKVCGTATANIEDLARDPVLHARIRDAFLQFNRQHTASSRRIARVLLMTEPASIDGNEITDKGYINQRAVLARRRALVERLYSEKAQPDVVVIGRNGDLPATPALAKAAI
jgi:feruloyl-CoA synthase